MALGLAFSSSSDRPSSKNLQLLTTYCFKVNRKVHKRNFFSSMVKDHIKVWPCFQVVSQISKLYWSGIAFWFPYSLRTILPLIEVGLHQKKIRLEHITTRVISRKRKEKRLVNLSSWPWFKTDAQLTGCYLFLPRLSGYKIHYFSSLYFDAFCIAKSQK